MNSSGGQHPENLRFSMTIVGNIFKSIGSALLSIITFLTQQFKDGGRAGFAVLTAFGNGINNFAKICSKPMQQIMWVIGVILLIIVIVLLLATVSTKAFPQKVKDKQDNQNNQGVTNIFIQNGASSDTGGSFLSKKPRFPEIPSFSIFNTNYYTNYMQNNEPFASGLSYTKMAVNMIVSKTVETEPRKVDEVNRPDNISVISIDGVLKNVVKPANITWKLKEHEHRDFSNLPKKVREIYRERKDDEKEIKWELNGDEWVLDCPHGTNSISPQKCAIIPHTDNPKYQKPSTS